MRKTSIIVLLALGQLGSVHAKRIPFASPIDTVLTILKDFPFERYAGKPVDSLLKGLPPGVVEMMILPAHNAKYGNCLAVRYPNGVYVWIRVTDFSYMNPWLDPNRPQGTFWNIDLFKKEKIAFSILYDGAACLRGCEYHAY